jgi:hypothetical protein
MSVRRHQDDEDAGGGLTSPGVGSVGPAAYFTRLAGGTSVVTGMSDLPFCL